VVNDKIHQKTKNAIGKKEDRHVPAKSIFSKIKKRIYPGGEYDSEKKLISIKKGNFNINRVGIEQKPNGTKMKGNPTKQIPEGETSS
jgi:hypothetical protein